ncbi:MAG: 50S ribosomal protein L35 [Microgenomates group bacterium]
MAKKKQKTKKSAIKRFKVTKKGKVLYRQQGFRHLISKKNKKWLRRKKKLKALTKTFAKKVKKMLSLK